MKKNFCFLFLSILIITSCNPGYIPNMVNSPMFREEGDIRVRGGINSYGYDLQSAYSATDNIGVILSGSYNKFNNNSSYADSVTSRNSMIEGGVGYYIFKKNKFHIEVFGGYGVGKGHGSYDLMNLDTIVDHYTLNNANLNLNRWFIQPAIGISSRFVEFGYATRLSVFKQDIQSPVKIEQKNYSVLLEPAITFKVGYKFIKCGFQYSLAMPLDNNYIVEIYPAQLSVFLQLSLNIKKYLNE